MFYSQTGLVRFRKIDRFFEYFLSSSFGSVVSSSVITNEGCEKMIMMNGDHLSDDEDEVIVDVEEPLIFHDETHHHNLLHSLNTMRKNRTFCDVILHVSIYLVIL